MQNGLYTAKRQTACPHQGRHQSGGGSAGKPDLSPVLTAEWENRLTEIAKGNADADEFMAEIEAQVRQLVKTYSCISADKAKPVPVGTGYYRQVSPVQ